jgi:hypothetical protein
MTGAGGSLSLEAAEPGRYLLVARHKVPEGREGFYDEMSFTATLSLMVTR